MASDGYLNHEGTSSRQVHSGILERNEAERLKERISYLERICGEAADYIQHDWGNRTLLLLRLQKAKRGSS